MVGTLPVVMPWLGKEDITGVGHAALVYRVQAHHRHMEQNLCSVTCNRLYVVVGGGIQANTMEG